jgi:hypothetical protein
MKYETGRLAGPKAGFAMDAGVPGTAGFWPSFIIHASSFVISAAAG